MRFRTIGRYAVALLVLFASGATAAENLTLEEALRTALKRNAEVLSAQEEVAKAEGYYTYARSGLLPSLSLNGTAIRRNEESSKPEEESTLDLALSQYLYAGGVLTAGAEQAELGKRKAAEALQATQENVALLVYDAYCHVLLKRANLETAREELAFDEKYAEELRKRVEHGLSTKLDLSRAEQQMENARADGIAAENALASARIELFTMLRLPPESAVAVSGDLDMAPLSADEGISVERALRDRPDLKSLRTDEAMQRAAIEIAEGGMKPTVTLGLSYRLADDSSAPPSDNEDEWTATLTAKVPVFDGGMTKGKVQQEEAVARQKRHAVEKKEEAVRAEVVQAYLTIRSSFESLRAARKNLDLATESLRLAQVGYREGVNAQLDVLEARKTLTQARQKVASFQKEYRVAVARLWRAEGALVAKTLGGTR